MEKRGFGPVFLCLLVLAWALPVAESMVISNNEYMSAYFVMYADYLQGNGTFTQEELVDVVHYYLTTEDLAGSLYQTGDKSGEMIGDILVKAGVVFDCGTCDASLLGIKCCIYRADNVPAAYECVGNEVLGVETYSWIEMWQCTYGCCGAKCCLDPVTDSTMQGPQATTAQTTSSSTIIQPTTTTSSTTMRASTTSTTVGPTTPIKPVLTLLFVPVDWTGSTDDFYSDADTQAGFIAKSTALKDCPQKVKAIKQDVVCRLTAPLDDMCTNILQVKREVEACAKKSGEEYDYVVGVWPGEFCGVVGLTFGTGTIFLRGVSEEILTHEMGHEWGLVDEYFDVCRCMGTQAYNCLDASIGGGDPAGSELSGQPFTQDYCAGGAKCAVYQVSCMGNLNSEGGRCIMGPAGAPGPRTFCGHCREHLNSLDFLKC